jgi:hypothetical protein
LSPGCTGKESEGGDHKVALMQNKLKAKSFKWRSSNSDMNKVEAGGSDEVYNDTVLCSLSTASFSSLVSRKRVRNLGKVFLFGFVPCPCSVICFLFFMFNRCVHFAVSKVAEQCDAVDPPVPRKLRSGTN